MVLSKMGESRRPPSVAQSLHGCLPLQHRAHCRASSRPAFCSFTEEFAPRQVAKRGNLQDQKHLIARGEFQSAGELRPGDKLFFMFSV